MIAGIEMFLGVDGKQVGMEITEYQMAANSIGVTRRLERNVDRRWSKKAIMSAKNLCHLFFKVNYLPRVTKPRQKPANLRSFHLKTWTLVKLQADISKPGLFIRNGQIHFNL